MSEPTPTSERYGWYEITSHGPTKRAFQKLCDELDRSNALVAHLKQEKGAWQAAAKIDASLLERAYAKLETLRAAVKDVVAPPPSGTVVGLPVRISAETAGAIARLTEAYEATK